MWNLWDSQEEAPPAPPRSSIFVMRNGRYEPQNLMPVMPRPDILDFDGFVLRRGAANRAPVRPPDLRQASLVKSSISLRKATVQAKPATSSGPASPSASPSAGGPIIITFVYDALEAGQLSLYLRVIEVEHNDTEPGGPVRRRVELTAEGSEGSASAGSTDRVALAAIPLHEMRFEKGLGQVYVSPALELSDFSQEQLRFNPELPREIPLAVRLVLDCEATAAEGENDEALEERSVHYTYISLQKANALDSPKAEEVDERPPWSAHVIGQKLEHSGQCFILHEVFGAGPTGERSETNAPRQSLAHELEGNTDCVICLSEPRDTAVLPCRHMCFCSYCAGIVRLQCDRCPVCRQKVQSLLQFKREEFQP